MHAALTCPGDRVVEYVSGGGCPATDGQEQQRREGDGA